MASSSDQDHDTPTKAKVQGAVEFCKRMGIPYYKNDVFRTFNVSKAQGYQFLNSETSAQRRHNDPEESETRGRKSIVSTKDIREMEKILEEEGFEARALTWQQLGFEAGLDCSEDMIKRVMGTMNYHKCIACRKGWISPRTATKQVDWSTVMLERYPDQEDWHPVRFSNEVHFNYGPQGKLRIIRKPGERYCQDCIQEADSPKEKDLKQQHCWAAVGHNFKSDIHFYNVPGNGNDKMSMQVYLEQILKPIVKPWIDNHPRFVLKEDSDSGHGTGKSNTVRSWKKENKLEYYFNCPSSPDLSPIENTWLVPKQEVKKYPHWDDRTTRGLIYEGWSNISTEFINEKVASMPDRLRAVIDGEGKMTGY